VVGSRPPQLWPLLISKAVLKVLAAYRCLDLRLVHQVGGGWVGAAEVFARGEK
jgi:hypothetical protein